MKIIAAVLAIHLMAAMSMACMCGGSGGCGSPGCTCGCNGAETTIVPPSDDLSLASENIALPAGVGANITVNSNFFGSNPTITVGQSVVWNWLSGFHTVTSAIASEPFNSGGQGSGTFTHTFLTPGHYTYYCQFHGFDLGGGNVGGMSGFINVVAVPEPATVGIILLGAPVALMRRRRVKRSS